MGVETKHYVADFARKKQVQIVFEEESDDLSTYRSMQNRFELVKQLQDMLAVVTFLEANTIESDKLIYEDMTLKTLAENAYEEIVSIAKQATSARNLRPPNMRVKEKIGTLLNTKEMNPALFFALSFYFGVYMPVLAPFIVPFILTTTLVIRGKLFKKFCDKKT